MVKNLKDLMKKYSDEDKCRELFIQQRWEGGVPVCPYCESTKSYVIENGKRFKCGNQTCYKKYSVTVGTVFHASNIPLTTWFPAMYLIASHKKGISSCQLARDLGVTQKTAWFMLHRIRESLREKGSELLSNIVEVDEVYIGGKVKNMSKAKRASMRTENGGTINNKYMVMGMLERDGDLRLIVSGKADTTKNIKPIMKANIHPSSCVITDASSNYYNTAMEYKVHETVNHTEDEFVRSGIIHTNSIEGAFSMLKRAIVGTYHSLSPKHLFRYCNETSYRYNTRKIPDGQRFEMTLTKVAGRLSYKELIQKTELSNELLINPDVPYITIGMPRPVHQLLSGEIIATFPSLKEASKAVGISSARISNVCRGQRKSAKGFTWKYA